MSQYRELFYVMFGLWLAAFMIGFTLIVLVVFVLLQSGAVNLCPVV